MQNATFYALNIFYFITTFELLAVLTNYNAYQNTPNVERDKKLTNE